MPLSYTKTKEFVSRMRCADVLELELIQTQMTQKPEANAAGRCGSARALRKQSKCRVYHEGEGHWPNFSQKLQKSEAFVGSAHSAETIKRKARERSS